MRLHGAETMKKLYESKERRFFVWIARSRRDWTLGWRPYEGGGWELGLGPITLELWSC